MIKNAGKILTGLTNNLGINKMASCKKRIYNKFKL